MKSYRLFAILILQIAGIAVLANLAAAEKEVFSGKVYTNKEKAIDNSNWSFLYDLQSQKTFVDFSTSSIIIIKGSCDARDAYRICIDDANFSSRDYTTYVDTYELRIRVFKITPDISVNRTLSPGTLLQGEKGLVKVIIDNPSNFEASDIEYKEDFSKFEITGLEGCENRNGMIQWKGDLKLRYSKECSFKIAAYEKLSIQSKANLTYNDGFSVIASQSPVLGIIVKEKQLKAAAGKSSWIEPKITFQYNLTFENLNEEEGISAHLTSLFPSYVRVKKKPGEFWGSGNELYGNINLKAEEKKVFAFTLEADSGGSEPVRHKFAYTINDLDDTIDLKDPLDVKDIKPEISIILSNSAPKPNENFVLIADIKNPSRLHDFANIKAELTSEFIEPLRNELKTLKFNQSYRILSNTLGAPDDIDKKLYTLNLRLLYNFNGRAVEIIKSVSLGGAAEAKVSQPANITINTTLKTDDKSAINSTEPEAKTQNETAISEQIAADGGESEDKTKAEAIGIEDKPEGIAGIAESIGLSGKNIAIILTVILFAVLITLKFMFRGKDSL